MNTACNWIQLHAMLITTYYSILTSTPMVENGSAIIYIYISIYKTEASKALAIFHVNTIFK